MSKLIRMSQPSGAMQMEILRTRQAIEGQQYYMMKCPYCHRSTIRIFDDTQGHIQVKCKACRKETVFDVGRIRAENCLHRN